jgi:hypothetical protein
MRIFIDAGMGTNAAGAWQKVAKLLQECRTKQLNSAEVVPTLKSVQQLLDRLEKLPAAPKAVWKKLVQQLKVSEASHNIHKLWRCKLCTC